MTWNSEWPVFPHDVDKGVDSVCLLTQQSRIGDVQILFVVESGKSFIAVNGTWFEALHPISVK